MRLAGCIIADDMGRILLLHRNTTKRRQWEIPGGKIDEGEEAEQAALREVKEELNVDVEIIDLLGAKEFNEDDFSMHYTWFAAKITNGSPEIMEPETFDDLRYFSVEDLRKMIKDLSPNTQNYLNRDQA